ncbi:hypothetical protein CDAR_117151 [Caerostris darwini]|uniref:Uncharacterized protein n=1 Tax=Caerostris darwini TaxID=1538125 RepID=A0AAV4WW40_9ARAC|nr:hypothetical protein CDAR_117151 [Caerostris darwini]
MRYKGHFQNHEEPSFNRSVLCPFRHCRNELKQASSEPLSGVGDQEPASDREPAAEIDTGAVWAAMSRVINKSLQKGEEEPSVHRSVLCPFRHCRNELKQASSEPLPVWVSRSRPLTEPAAEIDTGAMRAVINKSYCGRERFSVNN